MSDGHNTSRVRHQQDPVECKIDKLTDELLVDILSCLSVKEAAKTSLASSRWRYLWKYTSGCLELYEDRDRRPEAALEFMKLVNQVLKLHQGPTLDQFRVGFTLQPCCSMTQIDRWVEFAIQKEVKVLELNLAAGWGYHVGWSTYYFPDIGKLLSGDNIGKLKFSRVCSNLKSLTLSNVNVKDKILQFFLSNCPCLEQVCVSGSECLQNLKVTDPLPSLKSMEIIDCYKVKCLEFDAPNLVSFTYVGPDRYVPLQNYPHLSELTIGGQYCYSFIFNADKHISYASNLRKIKLRVGSMIMRQSWLTIGYPDNFPRLKNLRELELDILVEARNSLLFFSCFIKASPLLSRFTVRVSISSLFPSLIIYVLHVLFSAFSFLPYQQYSFSFFFPFSIEANKIQQSFT